MRRAGQAHVKVPEVTAYFWIIKILTTAMGESTSDYVIHRVGLSNKPALAAVALLTGGILALTLALQIRARQYIAWIYWLAVAMVAIFGTMAADAVHVALGIPYAVSSTMFVIALAVIFYAWYSSERTLSIHSIYNQRRELFYWAVVIATFALGTAVGDLIALGLHLGFLTSGLLFTVLILVPAAGYRWFGWNEVFAFWFAYVLTRPLGASYADWLGFPHRSTGLGLGHPVVAASLTVLVSVLVAYMAISRKDVPRDQAVQRAGSSSSDPSS
jgi:uncharacterized membrane-anchored protein